jgi:signal transduction histidine kinase
MFFGFSNGAISFFPDEIVDNTTPPLVVLTDFRLFGTPVSVAGDSVLKESISVASSITLPPRQNTFSLEFAALSFRSPERNRYRIRLENFEKRWNEISSNRRFTTYTGVAPGEYLFRVQASNGRGTWNETGASLRIRILPPWWSTWWFRAASAAAVLMMLWATYQYRLYQIAREFNAQLEGRVDERLRVARDLHDTLLQSFHGLLMRFQAAHNLLPGRAADARNVLETALDDAAKAITQARDAVQDLRSSSAITSDLAKAVEAVGYEFAAQPSAETSEGPSFSVELEGAVQDLHPILRDEIYGIAREALRNAFRHARAQRIEVEISYEARQLRVRVRDDGIGIDRRVLGPEGRPGHWGMSGMRERAKRVGGHLEVWSEHGAGTEIEVTVPAAVAYGAQPGRGFRLFTTKVRTKS